MSETLDELYVVKRDGRRETFDPKKITERISRLAADLDKRFISPRTITAKVLTGVKQGITTVELDELSSEIAAYMTSDHHDYATLASRIVASNLHKQTPGTFSEAMNRLHSFYHEKSRRLVSLISDETISVVREFGDILDKAIVHERDMEFSYFGFKTLQKNYLMRVNNDIVERPQYLYMRVAVGIHGRDIEKVLETYDLLSRWMYSHATPTMYHAGSPKPQLSSCFLLPPIPDDLDGIYQTLKNSAMISKHAGGVGLACYLVRASGSYIAGTNGYSDGLVPLMRLFNNSARYSNQSGKRPGSIAVYITPWHADIFGFLELKRRTGKEEERARDLHYALWIPDIFMKRVEENGDWPLFCPQSVPKLTDTWGDEFEKAFLEYEKMGIARTVVKAQKLWFQILTVQIEEGTPYMLYMDACNRKSNQKNLGTITCSNLCTEIIEYTSPEEIAVCNLASICLPRFVKDGRFDFEELGRVTRVVTTNLNRIIDLNYYPVEEAKRSNLRHRPMGIGVQGLADTFIAMRMPFDSKEAAVLNKEIFETIQYNALLRSCELAQEEGRYESFKGSPASEGILQPDLWGVDPGNDRHDWKGLREMIVKHGLRNSLLTAPMPTASTAQITGNNECIEPYTSNIYSRRVSSGEFVVVNQWLVDDLVKLELWNKDMKNKIVEHNGSVASIEEIPAEIRALYKTAWEIDPKVLVDLAVGRGPYIDQSQSLNIWMSSPDIKNLTKMHFRAWKKGLKTGMYYLRTQPAVNPIKFTVEKTLSSSNLTKPTEGKDPYASRTCSIDDPGCVSCSS